MYYSACCFYWLPLCLGRWTGQTSLFIAVDDMNDWIGCLDSPTAALTPNIDKLAARGVNFSNAHTAGVYCDPSRAAIFSSDNSQPPAVTKAPRILWNTPQIESLQTSFTKAGYATFGGGQTFSSFGRQYRYP